MTGTRWLTPGEQATWRAFLGACQAFFSAMDAQLQREAQMPHAYYEILVRLSETPGRSMRMSQLAEAAAASKSRISHAVARLEERGWVRRVDCPTDRRGQIAELTQAGFDALECAAPGHVEQVRRSLFDPLAPGQVRQLREICDAIIAARGPQPQAVALSSCPAGCPEDEDLAGDVAAAAPPPR